MNNEPIAYLWRDIWGIPKIVPPEQEGAFPVYAHPSAVQTAQEPAVARCSRCGRYEDGSRECPNGDSACPVAHPAPAVAQTAPVANQDAEILQAVLRELNEGDDSGNAPGHAHHVPGIWDSDNGDKAGKPCAWCLTWAKFTALVNRSAAPVQATPSRVMEMLTEEEVASAFSLYGHAGKLVYDFSKTIQCAFAAKNAATVKEGA